MTAISCKLATWRLHVKKSIQALQPEVGTVAQVAATSCEGGRVACLEGVEGLSGR